MRILVILSVVVFLCFIYGASAENYGDPLYCRGPLEFRTGPSVTPIAFNVDHIAPGNTDMSFFPGTRPSGQNGAAVPKGTCTWAGHGIRRGEPTKLFLPKYADPAFLACNADERCVFAIRAYDSGQGYFVTPEKFQIIWVFYPQFQPLPQN